MTTPGGGIQAGRLYLTAEVDFTGWRQKLKDELDKATKGLAAAVPVALKTDTLRRDLQAAVDKAALGITATVGVTLDSKNARSQLKAAVDKAATGINATVGVTLDSKGARAQLKAAVEKAAAGVTATIGVKLDSSDVRRRLKDAVDVATAGMDARIKPVIKPEVDSGSVVKVDAERAKLGRDIKIEVKYDTNKDRLEQVLGISKMLGPERQNDPNAARDAKLALGVGSGLASAGDNLGKVGSGIFGGLSAIAKPTAILAGANLIVGAIGSLIGGAAALVGALGPPIAALGVALPAALSAAALGFGTVKLAFSGVGGAMKQIERGQLQAAATTDHLTLAQEKQKQSLTKLSTEQRRFAGFMVDFIHGPLKNLSGNAAQYFLPKLEVGIRSAAALLPTLNSALRTSGGHLGEMAMRAGAVMRSPMFRAEFRSILGTGNAVLGTFRNLLADLIRVFGGLAVAGGPVLRMLATTFAGFMHHAAGAIEAGNATGRLAGFVHRGIASLKTLGHIVSNVGKTLFHIFSGGTATGEGFLRTIERVTGKWAAWTGSVGGKNAIHAYFVRIGPVVREIAGLIGDLVKGLGKLSSSPQIGGLIHQIRDQLLPPLLRLLGTLQSTGQGFSPALITALGQIVTLFTQIAATGGGLALYVKIIGDFSAGISWLITHVPGMGEVVKVIVALAVAGKLLGALKPGALAIKGLYTAAVGLPAALGAVSAGLKGVTAEQALANAGNDKAAIKNAESTASYQKFGIALGKLRDVAKSSFKAILEGATKMFGVLRGLVMTNPFTMILTGLILLGIAFYEAYKHSKTFRDIVQAALRGVKAAWDYFWAAFKGGLDQLIAAFVWVGNEATKLWRAFSAFSDRVVGVFVRLWQRVSRVATDLYNTVVGAFTRLWHSIDRTVTSIHDAVANGFRRVLSVVSGFVNSILGFVERHWRLLVTIIGGPLGLLVVLIIDHWNKIKNTFLDGWRAVDRFLTGLWNDAKRIFLVGWLVITGYVTRLWNDVTGLIRRLWRDVTGLFQSGSGAVSKETNSLWSTVTGFFSRIWRDVSRFVSGLWHDVTGFFRNLYNDVAAVVNMLWQRLVRGFTIIWNEVSRIVSRLWHDVVGIWNRLYNEVSAVVNLLWNRLTTAFSRIWHEVTGIVTLLWRELVNIWNRLHADIRRIISGVKDAVVGTVTRLWHEAVSLFRQAKDEIGRIWDQVREKVTAPIKTVVNVVYNKGLLPVIHAIGGILHEKGMTNLGPLSFAGGGTVPGTHRRDDVPIFATPGEVVVPLPVVGRFGGPARLMEALGFRGRGGGPGAHFDGGGGVSGFLGSAWNAAKGAVGGVASAIGGAATDLFGKGVSLLRGALAAPVGFAVRGFESLADRMLGRVGFGGTMSRFIHLVGDKLIALVKGDDTAQRPAAGSYGGTAGAAGGAARWAGVVGTALRMLGQPLTMIPGVLSLINSESGGNPNAINLWDCVTLDAVILTRRGLLKHDEVRVGDETIGYNPATRRSEWTRITRVVHYNDAPLVKLSNARWHATVTPNHRWISEPREKAPAALTGDACDICEWPVGTRRRGATTGGLRIHKAKVHQVVDRVVRPDAPGGSTRMVQTRDINTRDRLILAAPADTGDGLPISDIEAAILGWIAGDGHIEEGRRGKSMSIAQSKPAMVVKLRVLLADSDVRVYVGERVTRTGKQAIGPRHVFRFTPPYRRDLVGRVGHPKLDAVDIVMRMSASQRRAWLDAFIDAEGHRNGEHTIVYQAYGPVLEAAHLAAYLCGYRPRLTDDKVVNPNWSPSAHISLGRPAVSGSSLHREDAGVGDVWCVTTKLGTWTAEQDGQIFLTGNSNAKAGHPSRGLMQTIPTTFEAYRSRSLPDNIVDPLANIFAGINYALKNYGPAMLLSGGRHFSGGAYMGYADGGTVRARDGGTMALVAEAGRSETILDTADLNRGFADLRKMLKNNGAVIHVHPSHGMDEVELARKVDHELGWSLAS